MTLPQRSRERLPPRASGPRVHCLVLPAIRCQTTFVILSSVSDTLDVTGERIRSIVERIEHIEEEIKALNEGKKEIFQEAKSEGYDLKVIKEIIRLRKQDKDERDEHESLLDLYLSAMASPETERSKAA